MTDIENLRSKHINIIRPLKKSKWKLYVDVDDDKNIEAVHTGWYGGPNNQPYYQSRRWENGKVVDVPPPTWVPVQPFVFEGGLIPGGSYRGRSAAGMSFQIVGLKDADTGWRTGVGMHISGVEQMLKDLAAGKCELYNGAIHGRWAFKKGGANVFVEPYNKDD